MILGIGVDSIEISRVVKAMEKEHFVHRIFTEKERAEMEHAKRRGASDFAGKEAVVKAFGPALRALMPVKWKFCEEKAVPPMLRFMVQREKKQRKWGLPIGRFLSQIQRKLRRHL